MQLPLITLIDRMKIRPEGMGLESTDMMIKGLRLLDRDTDIIEDGILYIADKFFPTINWPEKSAVIYTCEPVKESYCALFAPGQNTTDITNELLVIWEFFSTYDAKIMQAIYNDQNLQNFVQLCSEVMGNPAYIVDSSFKVVAIDDHPLLQELSAIWKNLVDSGYLSYDIVASLKANNDIKKMESYNRAILFDSDAFNNEFINYNLRHKEHVMGHFFVVGYKRKITQGDIAYANFLGEMLLPALQLDKNFAVSRGRDYENFFIHVLSGALKDIYQISAQLRPLKWDMNGRYMIFAMKPADDDEILVSTLFSRLENIQSGKPVLHEGYIVAVFPLKDEHTALSIENKVKTIVSDNGGVGGLSDEFDGFQRLSSHYKQAISAIELSAKEPGSLYTYREYALSHILKTAGDRMDLDMTCEKAVFRLHDYDGIHNTEYLTTLESYLKNERSIVLTSKELNIHRNTLMYRIGKIEHLFGIDLNDAALRQWLFFSFWVFEYLKTAKM